MIEYLSRAEISERLGLSLNRSTATSDAATCPTRTPESAATMNYSGNPFSSWIGKNFNPINK